MRGLLAVAIVTVALAAVAYLALSESRADRCQRLSTDALISSLLVERQERVQDTVTPPPPPRPSDMRWYQEHCWQGKPR